MLYSPFKPHVIKKNGYYHIRKLGLKHGFTYLSMSESSLNWGFYIDSSSHYSTLEKVCDAMIDLPENELIQKTELKKKIDKNKTVVLDIAEMKKKRIRLRVLTHGD